MTSTRSCRTIALLSGILACTISIAQEISPEEYRREVEEFREQVRKDAGIVLDPGIAIEARLEASSRIEAVYDDAQVAGFLDLAKDGAADPRLRSAAVRKSLHHAGENPASIDNLLASAGSESADKEFRATCLEALAVLDFTVLREESLQSRYRQTLHGLTGSAVDEFKELAYGTLAAKQDEVILKQLVQGVLDPGGAPLPPGKCIEFLAINPRPDLVNDLQPALAMYPDGGVKEQLLRLLPVSSSSRDAVAELLVDATQPLSTRLAAVEGLAAASPRSLAASFATDVAEVKMDPEVGGVVLEKLKVVPPASLRLEPNQAVAISLAARGYLENGAVDKDAKRAAWDYLRAHDKAGFRASSTKALNATLDPELKGYFARTLREERPVMAPPGVRPGAVPTGLPPRPDVRPGAAGGGSRPPSHAAPAR